MAEYTVTFSEKSRGWNSFWGFFPQGLARLNNRFFQLSPDGQLYLANDHENPVRNNFFGEQQSSKIVAVINDINSEDKIFKNIMLESNRPWDVKVTTNYTESTIAASEFNQRESKFYAFTRRNENASDLHGLATQGIGVAQSIAGLVFTFGQVPDAVCVGDVLWQLNGSNIEEIGVIDSIVGNVITVESINPDTTPLAGLFCFAKKSARAEASPIRGIVMTVELENSDTQAVELFAIESSYSISPPALLLTQK